MAAPGGQSPTNLRSVPGGGIALVTGNVLRTRENRDSPLCGCEGQLLQIGKSKSMNFLAFGRGKRLIAVAALACLAASAPVAQRASAAEVLMKDGRLLRGKLGKVGGLTDLNFFTVTDDAEQLKLIVFLDDDLRRTFVPQRQIQEVRPDRSTRSKRSSTCVSGRRTDGPAVRTVGPIMQIQPFDEFGRRIITMNTARGPVDIIQGITEITPQWTKVEGITYMWDMRIATSSIPRDVLHKMLLRQAGDAKDIEQRKRIARFFISKRSGSRKPGRSWRPSSRPFRTTRK